ncbi:MAG: phage holin family protein [Lentimicrobium sp.]|nr:phage holin family protein [Lentimicrobium sp.]
MKFPFRLLLTTLLVMTIIYLMPGITAMTFLALLAAGVLIAFANTIPKRLFLKLKIPMNLMVFGFLILLLNIGITYLTSLFFPEFLISHFIAVLFFSIIVTGVTTVINSIVPSKYPDSRN